MEQLTVDQLQLMYGHHEEYQFTKENKTALIDRLRRTQYTVTKPPVKSDQSYFEDLSENFPRIRVVTEQVQNEILQRYSFSTEIRNTRSPDSEIAKTEDEAFKIFRRTRFSNQ